MRPAGGSLRGRLVLAFVGVAVLAAVLIGVITLSLIRLLPERGLEQQLADQAQAVSDTVAGPRPARQLCALARVLRRGQTEVYLLDADATPRRLPACPAPNRRGPLAPAPDADLAAALAHGQVTTGTGDGLTWAVVPAERPVRRAAGAVAQGGQLVPRAGGGCWPRPWRWRRPPWPPGCWPAGSPPPSGGWSRPPAGSAPATCRQGSKSTVTARWPRSPPPSTTWPPAWNRPRPSSAPSWPASATSSRPR